MENLYVQNLNLMDEDNDFTARETISTKFSFLQKQRD